MPELNSTVRGMLEYSGVEAVRRALSHSADTDLLGPVRGLGLHGIVITRLDAELWVKEQSEKRQAELDRIDNSRHLWTRFLSIAALAAAVASLFVSVLRSK